MSGVVSETISKEGSLLFSSFLFGMVLMLLYDVLRVLRRFIKHGAVILSVEDVCYWIFCSIGIFAMLYQENDGLLRWFVLGGVAIGMLAENKFISPFVIRILVKIFRIWFDIIKKIGRSVGRPLKKFFLFFKKQLKKIKKAFKMGLSKH